MAKWSGQRVRNLPAAGLRKRGIGRRCIDAEETNIKSFKDDLQNHRQSNP